MLDEIIFPKSLIQQLFFLRINSEKGTALAILLDDKFKLETILAFKAITAPGGITRTMDGSRLGAMAGGVGQAVRWVCAEPGIFKLFLKVKLRRAL